MMLTPFDKAPSRPHLDPSVFALLDQEKVEPQPAPRSQKLVRFCMRLEAWIIIAAIVLGTALIAQEVIRWAL